MNDANLTDDLLAEGVEVIELDDDFIIEDHESMEDEAEEPVEDKSILTFNKHKNAVYASDISKDNKLVITGSRDDMAYVWDVATGEIIFECTGHHDSVTEVGFNYNGQLVVSADMGGLIQVWSLKDKKLIWCNEGDDISWLFWHPQANIIFAGCYPGNIYAWEVPQGNCKVLPSHGSGSTCGKLTQDGKKLIIGYEDGNLKLWDIKSSNTIWQIEKRQRDDIRALCVTVDDNLIVLAPTGVVVKMDDGKILYELDVDNDMECITTNAEYNLLIGGSLDGMLNIWDMARKVKKYQINLKHYVTMFKWAKNGKLIVGTLYGHLYICDVRSGSVCEELGGHISDILSLSVASDQSFFVSTSDDQTAKIFALNYD